MKLYRRFCSAMLALCIIFSLSPAAYALQGDAFELISLTVELPGADAVRVRLRAEEACTLVAALYKDGALLETGTVPVTGAGGEREVSVPLSSGGTRYDLAKVFLVDSKTWKPLCDSISLSPMQQRVAALGLPESWQEELLLADAMGLPMEKLEQPTVSGTEMSLLLDHLVTYAASGKLAEWRALLPDFAAYEGPLTRFDSMAGLFLAAQTIGGRWAEPVESINEVWNALNFSWDRGYFTDGLFPGTVDRQIYMLPIVPGEYYYLDLSCFCFNFSRRSSVSGEFPFAYDGQANSIREDDPPTYAEAVLAVIRLILSDDGAGDAQPVSVLSAEKDAQLHQELQEAIDAILNSKTELVHSDTAVPGETYTGTAYYVSADGDDSNDGSFSNPWRTLEKVCREASGWGHPGILKTGDTVFFRRGDTFRFAEDVSRTLNIWTSGLTFSAYGTGEKPVVTGSSQSGVGAEKWELEFEDETTGVKIWKYYHDLRDVAGVVFNDGEAITKRVYEFWGENGYESCECNTWWMSTIPDGGVELKGRLLPLEESMTEDLTIISRPEHTAIVGDYVGNMDTGPLYLRCDAGNPGELYQSVEFVELETMSLVWLETGDIVFDNLSFRCNGNSFMKFAGGLTSSEWDNWANIQNIVVQNCEFAFGGGSVVAYWTMENGESFVVPQGDGLYNVVNNTTIRSNYFHDMLSTTATFESEDGYPILDGYYHVLDNVMVNTIAVRLDSTFEPLQHLKSVIVRGNHMWNTGRMDRDCYYYSEGSILLTTNYYDEFVIEGNVIYGTENGHESNGLLNLLMPNLVNSAMPVFAHNTYVQHRGRYFMYFGSEHSAWTIDDHDLMYMVRRLLRDTTSEFYIID